MNASLETHAQLAEGGQPSVRALEHPAMASEPVVAFDSSAGDPHLDASAPEMFPTACKVIALVRMQLVWPTARLAALYRTSGKASTSCSKITESWRLAPVTQNINGMPWRSVMT